MREIRHAARLLARTPGFTLLVSGLLALGIGASATTFTFFEAVFLKPLAVARPQELVRVVQRLPKIGPISSFREPYFEALRDHSAALATAFAAAGEYYHFALTAPAPAEDISVRGVTPEFFDGLGVAALHGRLLNRDDEVRRAETPAVLLSYRLWHRRFGDAANGASGADIAINGHHFSVVGVMPESFNGMTADTGPALWMTLSAFKTLAEPGGDPLDLEIAGRLKPGVSRSQAEAECRNIWQPTMNDYYRNVEHLSNEDAARLVQRGIELESLERGVSILRDNLDRVLKVLQASTLLLVLIVCFNIGGILLARHAARRHEYALRLALGASPLMLLRQVLAEALLLAVAGSAGGILLTVAAVPIARTLLPTIRDRGGSLLPLTLVAGVDRSVVFFAIAVGFLALVCFSAVPAIAVSRSSLDHHLRSARSSDSSKWRGPLILAQVALCTVLLLTASLFVRTLQQLRGVDIGFDVDHIATFTGELSTHGGDNARAFLDTLRARVGEIPGVVSTSLSSVAVMRGRGMSYTIAPAGERMTAAHFLDASGNTVSGDYFATMGMRVVGGSGFSASDRLQAAPTGPARTVVNQAFATKFFPAADPIGRHFGPDVDGVASARFEIVGVVNDAKYRSLREPVPPTFYMAGIPGGSFVLNVRSSGRPDAIIEPVRRALASIDPALPFLEVHTMAEEVGASVATERLTALLAAAVGGCAALFAGAGIYGSLAYIAALRRREIAIRMALGAGPVHSAAVVAKQTLTMVGLGALAGLGAALTAGSVIRSMLFDISPQDATSIVSAVAFVVLVAATATAVPVLRAVRRDPAEALRQEDQ